MTHRIHIAKLLDLAVEAYDMTSDEETPMATMQFNTGQAIVLSLLEVADAIESLKSHANS